ncbi:MAG: phenylacetic acid degradation protein [Vicingaceae bacterium]|nr:MAG: phenylacetic acid degradation protein [Vicingaceae bacterium]
MDLKEALFKYCLRLGDNNLILSHRLSEWCSNGPTLEEDVALTNIALDKLGQARFFLQYAAEIEGKGRTEDDLAYLRYEHEFFNTKLVELPRGDFAFTIVRELINDLFDLFFYEKLLHSKDEKLAGIAAKALKEVKYHVRHASSWIIRLGDGTEESHRRSQNAINELWPYTGELFMMDDVDKTLIDAGIGVDLASIKPLWDSKMKEILTEATLQMPEAGWMQNPSKFNGVHTEHLGYILAEMQYLPRAYPGAKW